MKMKELYIIYRDSESNPKHRNEKHETLVAESKKVEQLKIIYNLNNKIVMKSIINDLLESQRHEIR